MKTLIDTLRMPKDRQEFGKYINPEEGEDPFFVLLEDDKLVTSFSVESDKLLDYNRDGNSGPPDEDLRQVILVINVAISPYNATLFNLNFA